MSDITSESVNTKGSTYRWLKSTKSKLNKTMEISNSIINWKYYWKWWAAGSI